MHKFLCMSQMSQRNNKAVKYMKKKRYMNNFEESIILKVNHTSIIYGNFKF